MNTLQSSRTKNIIVIVATSNYKDYLYAFLQSAHTNLKKGLYELIVIHRELEDDIVKKAKEIARNNFNLVFYDISNYPKKNISIDLIQNPKYWRLIGPYVVGEAKRVLYIDLDTLILEDFSEIFMYDLNGKTIGACIDYLPEIQDGVNNWKELKLDPHAPYFNSGVLLIDVVRYKEKNIIEKVFDIVEKNHDHLLARGKWPQDDQYGLNIVLVNDWLILPAGYNYGSGLKNKPTKIKILHFIGAGKPSSVTCKEEFTVEFLKYFKRTSG